MINAVQHILLCGLGFPCLSVPLLLKKPLEKKNFEVANIDCSILCSFLCNTVYSFITFSEKVDTDEN